MRVTPKYCRVAKAFAEEIDKLVESGNFIKTKETSQYIYGKCLGNCSFCEEYRNAAYFRVSQTVLDEEGNETVIEFEPRFAGEDDGT